MFQGQPGVQPDLGIGVFLRQFSDARLSFGRAQPAQRITGMEADTGIGVIQRSEDLRNSLADLEASQAISGGGAQIFGPNLLLRFCWI